MVGFFFAQGEFLERVSINGYLLSERDTARIRRPEANDLWEVGGCIVLGITSVNYRYLRYSTATTESGDLDLDVPEPAQGVVKIEELPLILSYFNRQCTVVICHRPLILSPEISNVCN
jgi:hypothetical protein